MAYDKELSLALELAKKAGDIALKYWQSQNLNINRKADNTEVTQSDKECERMLREEIAKIFPDDGFLGEEEGESSPKKGQRRWIIDPIDGTFPYIKGLEIFATLLALEVDNEIVLGVIHAPASKETYWAQKGQGAFKNGQKIQVSKCSNLANAFMVVGAIDRLQRLGYWEIFTQLVSRTYRQKAPGDYMSFGWVFEGKADFTIETDVKAWDLAPMKIIAQEAGAIYDDLNDSDSIYSGSCLITTPALHKEIQKLFSQYSAVAKIKT